MKNKTFISSVTFLLLLMLVINNQAWAVDKAQVQAAQVKAAFIYNFVKFVDWPEEKTADVNEPLKIGVFGKNPFENAFEKVKDTKIKGRKVAIKYFQGFEEIEQTGKDKNKHIQKTLKELGQCEVLFVCASEAESFKLIVKPLEQYHVLTISDAPGFLQRGGIINFVMEDKKVRFEINTASAERSKLQIRSKLLRLAKRVVENDKHSALIGREGPIVVAQK